LILAIKDETRHRPKQSLKAHRVADCVADSIRFAVPQPTEWERIRKQFEAAMILCRSWQNQQNRLELGLLFQPWILAGERPWLLLHRDERLKLSIARNKNS
jgi:hypothetical protein